jgi:hypothetical protein
MSHFTVTVKIKRERFKFNQSITDVDDILEEMLAPYCEHEGREGQYKKYFEFVDDEDELRKKYETESSSCVRLANGEVKSKYEEEFRRPSGLGWSTNDKYEFPPGAVELEVPHRERFSSFEAFVEEWEGNEARDPKHGRYGHYANLNAKWDWYCVGGRWTGHFPVVSGVRPKVKLPKDKWDAIPKVGYSDVVSFSSIDLEKVDADHVRNTDEFFTEYRELLAGKEFKAFEGPRSRAMSIGLLRVVQGPYPEPKENEVVIPWKGKVRFDDDRDSWNDVALRVTPEQFRAKYSACFYPLNTYAALDEKGWHAPGDMGWFGCSDDEPGAYVEFAEWFQNVFIEDCSPTDVLVIVDCHI